MDFSTLRGFRILMPEEARIFQRVEDTLRTVFNLYGFEEIVLPTLEPFSLFERKSGEEIEKRMYTFTDFGGRKVALRPELTPSAARLFVQRAGELKLPVKWSYFGSVFRYDEPQKMRYREFWQAGVELIGALSIESDLEVMSVVIDSMLALGFKDFRVEVNDVRIFREMLRQEGFDSDQQYRVMLVIDKKNKISNETFNRELLAALNGRKELFDRVMFLLGLKNRLPEEALEVLEEPKLRQVIERLIKLFDLGKEIGLGNWILFSPNIVRGLAYYTGMVFEVLVEGIPYSVCGGGRYDNLISLYGGPDVSCVGMSFGVDRLVEAAKEKGVVEIRDRRPVFVAYIGHELKPLALKIARDLRMAGIKTDVELRERPLSKQLEYANKKGCKLVVLLGKRELEKKSVKVRDLDSGEESEIPLDRLIGEIKGKLA